MSATKAPEFKPLYVESPRPPKRRNVRRFLWLYDSPIWRDWLAWVDVLALAFVTDSLTRYNYSHRDFAWIVGFDIGLWIFLGVVPGLLRLLVRTVTRKRSQAARRVVASVVVVGVVAAAVVAGIDTSRAQHTNAAAQHTNAAATAICTTVNKAATDFVDLSYGTQASKLPYPWAATFRTLGVQGSNYGPPFLSEVTALGVAAADGNTATVSSDIGKLAQSCKTITGSP